MEVRKVSRLVNKKEKEKNAKKVRGQRKKKKKTKPPYIDVFGREVAVVYFQSLRGQFYWTNFARSSKRRRFRQKRVHDTTRQEDEERGKKKRNTGQDSEPGSRVLPCSLFFHLSPLLLFRPFKIRFWKGFGTKGGPLKRDDDILKIESRYYYSPPDEYAVRKITSRNCALVSQ